MKTERGLGILDNSEESIIKSGKTSSRDKLYLLPQTRAIAFVGFSLLSVSVRVYFILAPSLECSTSDVSDKSISLIFK